jgi:outer membrane lipoprotein SlyB
MKTNFKFKTQLIAFAYVMLVAVLFIGCADNSTTTVKRENEAKQRIYGKESTVYNGREYHIIEVDGVEYIASFGGGICPLVDPK